MPEITTREKATTDRFVWLACAGIVAAVVLIGNRDLIVGRAAPIWDATDYYGPMFSLVADHAKAWKLLLWNPWISAGSPDFADPQSGATSPILLLFGLLSSDPFRGFIYYWISAWTFGGFGMLILSRHLKCPPWGGLIASLGFISSGFYTGHGEHTTIVYSVSFLPWIVWRFDVALARTSYWNMVEVGVLWGLSALGGYPAIVILDPVFLAFWALGRVWFEDKSYSGLRRTIRQKLMFLVASLCLMGAIGTAVMSPCYIGFLEYTKGYSFRASALNRQRVVTEGPLPPKALLTFASPYLYLLNFPPHGIWPETDITMSSIYMGALAFSLAVVALLDRSRWRWWLGMIALFFMSCSVGSRLPIRGWLYDLLPPTRYFRFPSLFSAYGIFIFCVLAALATIDLDQGRIAGRIADRRRFFVVSGLAALAAGLSYRYLLRIAHLSIYGVGRPSRVLVIIWLSAVITSFLWWSGDISKRLFITLLVLIAMYDAESALTIAAPTMYSAASLSWWTVMRLRHDKGLDLSSKGLSRHLFPSDDLGGFYENNRNLATKDLVFANDSPMANQFFQAYVSDPVLNQIAVGSQRIWFSDHPLWLDPSGSNFAVYASVSHNLGVPPLILHLPEDMGGSSDVGSSSSDGSHEDWARSAESLSPAYVELLKYLPNTLELRYGATRDGWLLVSDRWAKGWTATVNGIPVEIAGANFLFRAVPVSRGENTVLFQYKPRGFLCMLILSWGTVGAVVTWGLVRRIVRAPTTHL